MAGRFLPARQDGPGGTNTTRARGKTPHGQRSAQANGERSELARSGVRDGYSVRRHDVPSERSCRPRMAVPRRARTMPGRSARGRGPGSASGGVCVVTGDGGRCVRWSLKSRRACSPGASRRSTRRRSRAEDRGGQAAIGRTCRTGRTPREKRCARSETRRARRTKRHP